MTTRRQFFAFAGVAAVTGLAACSPAPALFAWRGSAAFAVESTNGKPYLLALNPDEGTWVRALELDRAVGMKAEATVTTIPAVDGSGRVVLVWSNGDNITKAAIIDPGQESVKTLDYAVDSGVRGILGETLFSVLPGTSGESVAELMPLYGPAKTERLPLPFLPQVLGQGNNGLIFAANKGAGILLGRIAAPESSITISETPIAGEPFDLCMAGTDTVLVVGSTVPGHRPGLYLTDDQGKTVKAQGVETPRLVAAVDSDHVVTDDTLGSKRTVSMVAVSNGPQVVASAQLESDAPVRDLRRSSDGRIVVTQSDLLSVFDSNLQLVSQRPAEGQLISDR